MPVVEIQLARLARMVGADRKRLLDKLPYIGLDIESSDRNTVRVEYSPNRPDFGTDFGVARALRGLLGKEVGLPKYESSPSGITVTVDHRLSTVRPYIACATATGLKVGHEDVRQIISLQEDLHNGLGRKRKTVAIGLHDLDAIAPPISYQAVRSSFKFTPLGGKSKSTIAQILSRTDEGRAYGKALGRTDLFPIIADSEGVVLSFPPVINGNATKVSSKTRSIFIDVTSTDLKAGDSVLAVLATTLAEAGGNIGTVSIRYGGKKKRVTPDLSPVEVPLDLDLVRSVLGLDLTSAQVKKALGRSRMSVKGSKAVAARYRVDLMHPVDVAEEVALGYGVDKIGPLYPASKSPGAFNQFEQFLDSVSTIMAGSGMQELMTYELVDEKTLYDNLGRRNSDKISVSNPRSSEHSVLRDSLLPNLLSALGENVDSEYPQRIFEVGRTYSREGGGVSESWHLACLVAHSQASYTEAKMFLDSASRTITGKESKTPASLHWAFAPGRTASVEAGGGVLGAVGEVPPMVLEAFGIKVPVAGFEIDLNRLRKQLK